MFKRLLVVVLLLGLGGLVYLWQFEDTSPAQLGDGLRLVSGMGAKLGCSARYLSGFETPQIIQDLQSYSGLNRYLQLQELPQEGVRASIFGLSTSIAVYRPGVGCTLVVGEGVLEPVRESTEPRQGVQDILTYAADAPVQSALESVLTADNQAGYDTRAMLVLQDGRVVAEAYAQGISQSTPLLGWSMGKSVAAIVIGRMQALGMVDAKSKGLFQAWLGDERAEISLENLLQMSSGLEFREDYVPGDDATRMLFMSADTSGVALAKPLIHPPGTHFSYSSGTTNLLSRYAYEQLGASGQAMFDFLYRELFGPLALQQIRMEPDQKGVPVSSSYVYASARDWARLGMLMVDDGVVGGRRLLPQGWVAQATAPNSSSNEPRYGYQFWLNDGADELRWPSLPISAYAMLGNRRQIVMMLPEQKTVIVRLGWSSGDYPVDTNFARILNTLGAR